MPTTPLVKGLGPVARALLSRRRRLRRDPPVNPAALEALLARARAPGHAPARAFERAYGGLSFTEEGGAADDPRYLVGAAACLSADLSLGPPGRKKLVPVLYTPNDNAYFLDADGVAWGQDTIEDLKPVRVAPNARAMLSRLLLGEAVFFCPEDKKVAVAGALGRKLGLPALADASDADERWWSDGKAFAVERDGRTTVAYLPRARLAAAGITPPARPRAPATVTFANIDDHGPRSSLVFDLPRPLARVYAAFLAAARRPDGRFALGGHAGAITTVENNVRVALLADPIAGFTRKPARVEVFFRDAGARTLVNAYFFDVPAAKADALRDAWYDQVFAPWRAAQ